MRFKKGSMVEVMNKEVPASWCLAEIVSGNGHAFDVRYDGYQGVEKVPRRFLRPCPPVISSRRWVSGDIVEVFDENSWKVATVLKELKGGQFLVRLHGFTDEIRVQKTNVRERQSWIGGQWIPVGKILGSYGVEPDYSMKMGTQVPVAAGLKNFQEEDGCLPVYNDARFQESRGASKKLKQSSPFCSSLIGAKRFKPAEQDGSERHVSGHLYEKVVAFEGNNYMQASFNNTLNGYNETEKRKTNGVGCTLTRISEPSYSDDDQCSVGSCSVPSDGPNKLSSPYDADILSSDGESYNTSRDEQEVEVSVHRLELHAYRSTLEALYASGPLSWEKEALLTNLRINLHISNDEHLTELRNLISSGAGILD
uniref:uncharacterized protein LOC122608229 n=1 Tax=Erigeron canadensis TaxID=72917 RepID=UPI001CB8D28D|nr:uncharacterized protein LOC122608229 [Erigeron canadensis]